MGKFYAVTSSTWTPPLWAESHLINGGQLTTCPADRAAALAALVVPYGHLRSGSVLEDRTEIADILRASGLRDLVAMDSGAATAAQIRARIRAIKTTSDEVE